MQGHTYFRSLLCDNNGFLNEMIYKSANLVILYLIISFTLSPLAPETVAYDMPMPTCTYTIRKDELNGPILHYAKVGDQVVHRWECNSEMYGMLVHSCYVEDGQGERRVVINEKGCHVDQIVLGDPTYTESLNLAYRESYVFKFADRVGVRFSCEIKLCVKEDGGCASIVPPDCGNNYQNDVDQQYLETAPSQNISYDEKNKIVKRRASRQTQQNISALATADLISQYVYVLDTVDGFNEAERLAKTQNHLSSLPSSSHHYGTPICLSSFMFFTIILTVATAFAFITAFILHMLTKFLRTKHSAIETNGPCPNLIFN